MSQKFDCGNIRMMKKIYLTTLCLFFTAGCAFFPHKKQDPMPQDDIKISGNLVSLQKLVEGGALAFTDLKAGPLAVADEQTDRVSLGIIAGVRNVLEDSKSGITLTNEPHDAHLIFEGYIEEFSNPGAMSKLMLMHKKSKISVSGEIYERKTGLRVLSFASSKSFNILKQDPQSAAGDIGHAIGEFILKQLNKERM